jgi:multicomponent Na+:H+ antiporter subunit B
VKPWALALCLAVAGLLAWGAQDLPAFGDPDSPASTHLSPRYIEDVIDETEVPNMVTAVLADYRGYDTFGETTVIFVGGMALLLILRGRRSREEMEEDRKRREETRRRALGRAS